MASKYVPDGSWLLCDKGALPQQLKVTHHNNTQIYGSPLASEADKDPFINIPSMGVCSVLCSACVPAPLYWDKTAQGVRVNGYKLLVDEAKLQCTVGGRVSIFFSRAAAMGASNPLTVLSGGLLGGGLGALPFDQPLLNNLRTPVAPGQPQPWNNNLLNRYGNNTLDNLARTDRMLPVDELRWSQKTARGVFSDGRTMAGTRDAILRAGGNSAGVIPPLEVVQMPDGGYTSLDHRRGVAAIEGGATEVPIQVRGTNEPIPPGEASRFGLNKDQVKILNRNGGNYSVGDTPKTYEEAVRFRSAGQGGSFPLEGSPTVPRVTFPANSPGQSLPAPSRASQFIGRVSESIQSTRGISSANQWLIRNANSVAKAGRVLGRVTLVIGIVSEVYNIHNAYEADGGQVGSNTKKAIGGAIGGLGGAIAGAELGATIGVIGGPVGVVVGGVVGGIIGGALGAWGGSTVGGWF